MGKKYKNIYNNLTSMENIKSAYLLTKKGKSHRSGCLHFERNLYTNLLKIQQELQNLTYKIPQSNKFKVFEPKMRIINVLPFKDRIIQHAVNNILQPIFEPMFIDDTYACRTNKGTHKLLKNISNTCLNYNGNNKNNIEKLYFLKMDFSKYFDSINIEILLKFIFKKITDKKLKKLLIILLSQVKKGILIGNLLSQLFANLYGSIFDNFVKYKLKIKYYFRYMDDTLIIHHDKFLLLRIQKILNKFASLYLKLKFSKWSVNSTDNGITFVGYTIKTFKNNLQAYLKIRIRVNKNNFKNFKKKIKNFRFWYIEKYLKEQNYQKIKQQHYEFCRSWASHVKHTHNILYYNILQSKIFNDDNIFKYNNVLKYNILPNTF